MTMARTANSPYSLTLFLLIVLQLYSIPTTYAGAVGPICRSCDCLDPLDRRRMINTLEIIVNLDGTGDYTTVQAAVDAVPANNSERAVIKIYSGTYLEKVHISSSKTYVTFKGIGPKTPIISWNDNANTSGSTWNSSTVVIDANYFIAKSIAFRTPVGVKNTAPAPAPGATGGQGIALRISGDMAAFYDCQFWGAQDTLCDYKGRHFFKNCFIQGSIDFIFGNGQSIYTGCRLNSIATTFGSVAAQKRDSTNETTGYSFINCTITGTGTEVLLGRAWGYASRVVFSSCYFPAIIDPEGWNDWNNASVHSTVYFGEYNNSGPGAEMTGRVNYSKSLTDAAVHPFLNLTFIDAADWLNPDLY